MSPPNGPSVDPNRCVSRRRLLLGLSAGGTAALAGCANPLNSTQSQSLNPPKEIRDSPTEHVWTFPHEDDEIIQTYLQQAYRLPANSQSTGMRFQFGASVFSHSDYRHDQFTVRLCAPAAVNSTEPSASVFVEPPSGTWETFRVYRNGSDTVVTLTNLETVGTIHFDFIVEPVTSTPMPEALRCEFKVTAAKSGFLDEQAVASGSERFEIVREDG